MPKITPPTKPEAIAEVKQIRRKVMAARSRLDLAQSAQAEAFVRLYREGARVHDLAAAAGITVAAVRQQMNAYEGA